MCSGDLPWGQETLMATHRGRRKHYTHHSVICACLQRSLTGPLSQSSFSRHRKRIACLCVRAKNNWEHGPCGTAALEYHKYLGKRIYEKKRYLGSEFEGLVSPLWAVMKHYTIEVAYAERTAPQNHQAKWKEEEGRGQHPIAFFRVCQQWSQGFPPGLTS